MAKTVRQIARELGSAAVESISTVTTLAAAGIGGWIGYDAAPDTWDGWQAVVAGIGGIAMALAADELVEPVMRPLRRLTNPHSTNLTTPPTSSGATSDGGDRTPPMSVRDGIDRVAEAACADAASHAAIDACRIDRGAVLLTERDRWQGYSDGTASFYLAPGAHLHYWRDTKDSDHYPRAEYTFVNSADDTPIEVTAMRQLRELLETHANHENADTCDGALQTV
ncbi:hypothetical protein [Streptomyces sp. WAC05858]|uniref:hypothetical protein n=1 Tax=Streptomyces TaxID=1883 RepID=UPI000F77E7E2|nr:hypothetical protein [Streptomyces sp. WAC05858]RSS34548.1 hypothetical protein EF902_40445 [Streptomyces sp. WAC05858]